MQTQVELASLKLFPVSQKVQVLDPEQCTQGNIHAIILIYKKMCLLSQTYPER